MKKLNRLIDIARALKEEKQTGRSFHLTGAFNGSRLISVGFNDYQKLHPYHKLGKYKATRSSGDYVAGIHSEIFVLRRLKIPTDDITFFNVRIDNNGNVAMARPCYNYMNILRAQKFKKVIYTISENEHGIII